LKNTSNHMQEEPLPKNIFESSVVLPGMIPLPLFRFPNRFYCLYNRTVKDIMDYGAKNYIHAALTEVRLFF